MKYIEYNAKPWSHLKELRKESVSLAHVLYFCRAATPDPITVTSGEEHWHNIHLKHQAIGLCCIIAIMDIIGCFILICRYVRMYSISSKQVGKGISKHAQACGRKGWIGKKSRSASFLQYKSTVNLELASCVFFSLSLSRASSVASLFVPPLSLCVFCLRVFTAAQLYIHNSRLSFAHIHTPYSFHPYPLIVDCQLVFYHH